MSRGNILLVANWKSDVGYAWWLMENFWVNIAEHFSSKGMHSHLAYPKITTIPENIANSSITCCELDMKDHSTDNLVKIKQYIKNNDIRHMYLSDMPVASRFYITLRRYGIKHIVAHDHTPGDRTPASGLLAAYKRLRNHTPWLSVDHMIATTDYIKQRLIEVNCIRESKVTVAPNGIVPLDLSNIDLEYAHNEFDIPSDRKIIVTTGRANVYKGIDFFIKCADEMINHRGHKNCHFLFCGDGPDIHSFRDLVDHLELHKYFSFAGKRSDIRAILPSCDIAMHCSKGEVGYSLSILEYMSAGLPTLIPDRASTRMATIDGITGLIYSPGDMDAAIKALERCLDQDFAQSLGANAAAEVKQNYNLDGTNRALLAALDRVFQ